LIGQIFQATPPWASRSTTPTSPVCGSAVSTRRQVEVVHGAARAHPGDVEVDVVGVDRQRHVDQLADGEIGAGRRRVDRLAVDHQAIERRVGGGLAERDGLDCSQGLVAGPGVRPAVRHADLQQHRGVGGELELAARGGQAILAGRGDHPAAAADRQHVGQARRRGHRRELGSRDAGHLALVGDQRVDPRGPAGRDAGRVGAHRDDAVVVELPRWVDVAHAAGCGPDRREPGQPGPMAHPDHSTPRRPIDGMIGSDLNAWRCE
jgi:hypothetical protein